MVRRFSVTEETDLVLVSAGTILEDDGVQVYSQIFLVQRGEKPRPAADPVFRFPEKVNCATLLRGLNGWLYLFLPADIVHEKLDDVTSFIEGCVKS